MPGRESGQPPPSSPAHSAPFSLGSLPPSWTSLVMLRALLAALDGGSETCAGKCEYVRASCVYAGTLACACVITRVCERP